MLEEGIPTWEGEGVKIYTNQDIGVGRWDALLTSFLNLTSPGVYIAINAYLPRNGKMIAALSQLRAQIQKITGAATTIGFGPRFLHSTGQLHKGGSANALFIQITADPQQDLEIPMQGRGITFGKLQRAQAIGDYEALAARGRKILRLHLSSPEEIQQLTNF